MTNQMQGETLFAGWSGTGDSDWAYTPWLPVRGDTATFTVEVLVSSGVTLDWEVQTRTLDNAAASALVTGTSLGSPGVASVQNTAAAKELVRYRFKTGGTASVSNFVTLRALQPSWQVDR